MKIVESKRLEILNRINLGSLYENTKPQTFKGGELHKHLVERFNSGKSNTITEIANISASCYNISEDVDLFRIGSTITETLSTSLDSAIIYCFENIQRAVEDKNAFAVQLEERLVGLLEMDTLKEQQNAIRNGLINPYRTVHESVHMIQKMCEIKTKNNATTNTFEVYNPIAYSEVGSQNTTYIKLHGVTFGINESKVSQVNSGPSHKFESLSNSINELKYDQVQESFIYNNRLLGDFKISSTGITHNNEVVYESNAEFVNKLGFIVESKAGNQRERNTNKQILEALLSVKLNMDSFVSCDNIVVVENKQNGEKFAIFLMENSTYISVLKSVRYPNIITEYKSATEMVEVAKNKIGYDLTHVVSEQLVQESQIQGVKKAIVEAYNDVIVGLESRRTEILSNISDARNLGHEKRFKALNEALNLVNGLIAEQKQEFEKHL